MTLALILLWLLFYPLTQPGQGFTGDVAQVPASRSWNTIAILTLVRYRVFSF